MKKINLLKLVGSIVFGFLMTLLIVLALSLIGLFIALMCVSFKFLIFVLLCLSLFVILTCMYYKNSED